MSRSFCSTNSSSSVASVSLSSTCSSPSSSSSSSTSWKSCLDRHLEKTSNKMAALSSEMSGATSSSSISSSDQEPQPIIAHKLKTHACLLIDTILYPIAAGLLMHLPGLKVKYLFEDWDDYLESLVSASIEGTFLLLLATRMLCGAICIQKCLSTTLDYMTSSRVWFKKLILIVYRVYRCLIALWAFKFIFSSIIGDATFRVMSGNSSPSAEELRAGFGDARARVVAELQHDPLTTVWRFVFGVGSLIGSLLLYSYPARMEQLRKERKRCAGDGSTRSSSSSRRGSSSTGIVMPECGYARCDDLEGQQQLESNHTSSTRCDLCPKKGSNKAKVLQANLMCIVLGCMALYLNSLRWYTPVIYAYFSLYLGGNNAMNDDSIHAMTKAKQLLMMQGKKKSRPTVNAPNVIYIQHESLSGAISLNTDDGVKAMPFFQDMMHNDPNMYAFEHSRTVSGNTVDALPALMTGCLPYTKEGGDWVHEPGRAIGYEFYNQGYSTASFSSRALDDTITKGNWKMLYDVIVGGMETTVDPLSEGWPRDNAEGSADKRMLKPFEEWLHKLDNETFASNQERGQFYAQLYQFNQHYPYFKDPENPSQGHKYYDSLLTTDQFLEKLFQILEKTGQLDNTIIVGSGDHGDDPFKKAYVRLAALNSRILHPAAYIYYPQRLMKNAHVAERLRRNTQQLVHTLDMYPTLQSILRGGNGYDYLEHAPNGCITGVDLTSVDIPDDRVTISLNLVSHQKLPARLWSLSTRDSTGREVSLYHRLAKSIFPQVKQGKNNLYTLEYGECTRSNSANQLCMSEVSESDKETFRGAIQWIKHTNLLGEGVRTSELVEFFAEKVEWKQTGEMHSTGTNLAMEGKPQEDAFVDKALLSPQESSLADDSSIHSQYHESTLIGFRSAMLHYVQERLGTRSDDPSCDNILLFMPDLLSDIGSQLNSYLRAAMIASLTNKALVVLDAPQEVLCPNESNDYPLGLSSIIKTPEWLTRNCHIPCQATHGYVQWNDIRLNSRRGMMPPGLVEHTCLSDNGRESHVFPADVDMIQEYFDKHFKEQMLYLPARQAHDWALLIGADPDEATTFSQLRGDTKLWDYLGALMVRSNILQLQPSILNDAKQYSKPWGKDVYDAIYLYRGDDHLDNPEAILPVAEYWKSIGQPPRNYMPLDSHLRFLGMTKDCNKEIRRLYIATNDPIGVEQELDELHAENSNGVRFIYGCHRVKVVISPPSQPESLGGCAARYVNNIASIAGLTILQQSSTFVSELNSDFGRLARTSRLIVNPDFAEDNNQSPVLLKNTQIAWGILHPGAPGR